MTDREQPRRRWPNEGTRRFEFEAEFGFRDSRCTRARARGPRRGASEERLLIDL